MAIDDEVLEEFKDYSKEELERLKLISEIAKSGVELEYSQLRADQLRREQEEQSSYNSENRVYSITGGIGTQDYHHFTQVTSAWARQGKSKITVVINSPGGYVTEGLAIYDQMQLLKARGIRIVTVALGEAASMGGILLQGGDHRVITPNTFMLIHEVSGGAIGKTSEIKDDIKFQERLQDHCLEILSERSTLTKAQIKKRWQRKDWWLAADEAVDLGFADEVSYRY